MILFFVSLLLHFFTKKYTDYRDNNNNLLLTAMKVCCNNHQQGRGIKSVHLVVLFDAHVKKILMPVTSPSDKQLDMHDDERAKWE